MYQTANIFFIHYYESPFSFETSNIILMHFCAMYNETQLPETFWENQTFYDHLQKDDFLGKLNIETKKYIFWISCNEN